MYKEKMKDQIASFSDSTPHIADKLYYIYAQALHESKQTGQNLSSFTYEILEALNDYLPFLTSTSVMQELIYKSALRDIKLHEKRYKQARAKLIDVIEQELENLLEFQEILHEFCEERHPETSCETLSQIKSDILTKIESLKSIQHTYI